MTTRLVNELGTRAASGEQAFPTAAQMAGRGERFYRDVVRAGYRAPHLAWLAEEVASGKLDLEVLRSSSLDAPELRRKLLELRGVGPYAADNLLRLLGRHDYLGLDSWCRMRLKELYPRARDVDKAALKRYRAFGRYLGLAMWLDVTRHWFVPRD
jgi:N-glycosylase/DNA lyase